MRSVRASGSRTVQWFHPGRYKTQRRGASGSKRSPLASGNSSFPLATRAELCLELGAKLCFELGDVGITRDVLCRQTASPPGVRPLENLMRIATTAHHPLNASVLVLNRFYAAVHVINVRRAFCLLVRDLAEVIHFEE